MFPEAHKLIVTFGAHDTDVCALYFCCSVGGMYTSRWSGGRSLLLSLVVEVKGDGGLTNSQWSSLVFVPLWSSAFALGIEES